MKKTVKTADRGDQTRSALVQAALAAFSEKGFHGVSTREIAGTAQVNQALIGYHFGNKEGLYLAVFAYLCEQIQSRVDPFAGQIEARLHALQGKELPREESIALLLRLLEGLATLFTNPQSNPWAKLILSEQQSPTRAFDLLYERFMGRYMALMVELTRRIRPQMTPNSSACVWPRFSDRCWCFVRPRPVFSGCWLGTALIRNSLKPSSGNCAGMFAPFWTRRSR